MKWVARPEKPAVVGIPPVEVRSVRIEIASIDQVARGITLNIYTLPSVSPPIRPDKREVSVV